MVVLFVVGIALVLGSLIVGIIAAWNGWDSGSLMLTLLLLFVAGFVLAIIAAVVDEQHEEAACLKRGGAWAVVGETPGYWSPVVVGKTVVQTYHPPTNRYGCVGPR